MKQFWRLMLIIVCSIYLILLVFFSFAYYEYRNLIVNDHMEKSDVIVIYGKDNPDALFKKAKELKDKGLGDKIIISPFLATKEVDSAALMKKYDLKKSDIVPDFYSAGMKEAMNFVSEEMINKKYNSALVVANDYEMKRLKATFEKNDAIHFFNPVSIKHDHDSSEYKEKAQQEIWKLPKLWLNQS